MPYLLPPTLENTDANCVRVFYPDYPEFRAALLGALGYFTKWVAWERTNDNRAATAAALWRVAHELTVAGWSDGCGGDMSEDEIIDIINREIEKMTINNCITVNCGCGSGSGYSPGGGVDLIPPGGYVPPDTEPLPEPEPITPTQDYIAYKCNAAHYLYYQFRTAVLQLGTLQETGDLTMSRYDDAIAGVLGFGNPEYQIIWEVYYNVASWLLGRVSESAASIVQEMDRNYDSFICAAYSGDGVNDIRSRWLGVIDGLSLNWASRYYLRLLEQSIIYENWFYRDDWQLVEFPAGYTERDCSACAGIEEPIFPGVTIPDDLVFIPASQGSMEIVDAENATGSVADGLIAYVNPSWPTYIRVVAFFDTTEQRPANWVKDVGILVTGYTVTGDGAPPGNNVITIYNQFWDTSQGDGSEVYFYHYTDPVKEHALFQSAGTMSPSVNQLLTNPELNITARVSALEDSPQKIRFTTYRNQNNGALVNVQYSIYYVYQVS